MPGVVNDPVPLASGLPPVAAPYQSMVSPVPTDAVKVTVPVPHLVKGPAPSEGSAGSGLTTWFKIGDTFAKYAAVIA